MHMLQDLWLKTPLTAQPASSSETGCQYRGQMSISFLGGAGASSLKRPINLVGKGISIQNSTQNLYTQQLLL